MWVPLGKRSHQFETSLPDVFCNCNFPAVKCKLIKSIYVDEIHLNCVCLGVSSYEDQTLFSASTKEEEKKEMDIL